MSFEKANKSIRVREPNAKLHGFYFEDLKQGMEASFNKTINDSDVINFANITGDTNPVHLNQEFASKTLFKGRVIHGMLTASLISTVIGTKLPGPGCIYVSQNLNFKAPVKVGNNVTAVCKVKKIISDKRMIKMDTICYVANTVVLEGQATILVPLRPTEQSNAPPLDQATGR